MSRTRTRTLPEWAAAVRRLRERLGLSQEGLARRLDLSVSEVRRWDQGIRPPGPARAIALGKLAGHPDCWVFWHVAGIEREDVLRALGSPQHAVMRRKSRRWSDEAQEAAFSALELIFERAPSTVIEQTVDWLVTRGGKYGDRE
jgi:transcriptional regulator with XRE-family HTH domain